MASLLVNEECGICTRTVALRYSECRRIVDQGCVIKMESISVWRRLFSQFLRCPMVGPV
jgi:hypothetical protein